MITHVYPITLEQIVKIRNTGIEKVRMETTGGNLENNLSTESVPLINHIIGCLF